MYDLLQEFLTSKIMLRDTAVPALEVYISKLIGDSSVASDSGFPEKKPVLNLARAVYPDFWADNPFEAAAPDSVAIIPLKGMMQKNSGWTWSGYKRGVDELANILRLADANPDIAGTILLIDTPGGVSDSVFQMEDALRSRTKPCLGLIDGQCCSGGIYVASFCDELYAVNRLCEIGSIGVYITLMDSTKFYEEMGFKTVVIYPPESKFKNLEAREALEGKPERIIREALSPFAVSFQDIIKANRKNLDLSVEGIIEGRVFYAFDAAKNGLIDGIKNLETAVDRVIELSELQKSIFIILKK
jgi:protease-4